MHRSEASGVLGGLSRVRAIQLNDAHIFSGLDQVAEEAQAALQSIRRAYEALGISPARYRLSLPGAGGKYIDRPDMWERSTAILTDVLSRSGLPYEPAAGEAAFYGPKIDVQVEDSQKREFTLSTVQVDFHQPEQFDLHFIGAGGAKHRPVMVHRSVIGSVERAVELGLRSEVIGADTGSLGARIRRARLVPYQAVIGAKEDADDHVALRLRDGRRLESAPADDVLDRISSVVKARSVELL